MTSRDGVFDYAIVAWVVLSSALGYACFAYAILQTHGDALRTIVNRIAGGDV